MPRLLLGLALVGLLGAGCAFEERARGFQRNPPPPDPIVDEDDEHGGSFDAGGGSGIDGRDVSGGGADAADDGVSLDVPSTGDAREPTPDDALACFFDDDDGTDPACEDCQVTSCGDFIEAAFGVRARPTEPGGACAGFLECIESCACDERCWVGCIETDISEACSEAIGAADACGTESCAEVCDDESDDLCGNGTIDREEGEQCDGEDLAGATCESQGLPSGTLACGDNCTLDTSGCGGDVPGRVDGTCDNPIVIPSLPFTTEDTSADALDAVPNTCASGGGPDVIYQWTATRSGMVAALAAAEGEWDNAIEVRAESCEGEPIACNDDGPDGVGSSLATFEAVTGETYFIIPNGYSGRSGPFSMSIEFVE